VTLESSWSDETNPSTAVTPQPLRDDLFLSSVIGYMSILGTSGRERNRVLLTFE
jgi:hypothetical protein